MNVQTHGQRPYRGLLLLRHPTRRRTGAHRGLAEVAEDAGLPPLLEPTAISENRKVVATGLIAYDKPACKYLNFQGLQQPQDASWLPAAGRRRRAVADGGIASVVAIVREAGHEEQGCRRFGGESAEEVEERLIHDFAPGLSKQELAARDVVDNNHNAKTLNRRIRA